MKKATGIIFLRQYITESKKESFTKDEILKAIDVFTPKSILNREQKFLDKMIEHFSRIHKSLDK